MLIIIIIIDNFNGKCMDRNIVYNFNRLIDNIYIYICLSKHILNVGQHIIDSLLHVSNQLRFIDFKKSDNAGKVIIFC